MRQLIVSASKYKTGDFLQEWSWLIPADDTPIFITALGDWVFGKPDGSLWLLSLLEGSYELIARNSLEYNSKVQSPEWLEETFIAGWLPIAIGNGLEPNEDQCIGWQVHPIIGGKFEVKNLKLFDMAVYQSIMGQLHMQLRARSSN